MAYEPPLVSVILPCFNCEATLERAFASVGRQDYPAIEIIAIDDGSTDGTADILTAHEKVGVRVIRLQRNSGAAVARNAGLAAASGDYVAFLDADDEWLPGKLLRQMAVIAARPAMSFVAANASVVDCQGQIAESSYDELLPADPAAAWKVLLADTFVWTPTVLARRAAIVRTGGFDPAFVIGEDQDLWIRLALLGEVGYIGDVVAIVHEQAASLTRRSVARLLDDIVPMVRRHVAAQRHRLTDAEVKNILGRRYTRVGRNAYLEFPLRGAALIIKAMLLGYAPIENAAYLVTASPLARWAKRRVLTRKLFSQ